LKLETRNPDQHIGILLLAFGGPNSLDEVEPFLKNIFFGRSLLPSYIDQVRKRYRLIGGKSPLLEITERQARSLKASLLKAGRKLPVYIGMRHWHPYVPETIKTMEKEDIRKLLCLILSPYSDGVAAKDYKDAVYQAVKSSTQNIESEFLPSWHNNPFYIAAVAEKIREGLLLFSSRQPPDVQIVFTAHNLPQSMVRNDPYVNQIRATISIVMKRFKNFGWYLAFQSRGKRKEKWLSPNVEEVLEILAKSGKQEVLVAPLSFVSDNLETLHDLDIVLKKKADDLGLVFHRSPSLNDSPKFIKALTDIILNSLNKK